ncbi:hypothetical protein AXX12_09250 [Anaerosporomusa subterranea]|uniref:DUF421 domain-containing protein n=1 Tax=Anaerosporomusa subterranea TaxID=1794912 RepID=A0A154BRW6_ANASB|nr:DUF421 domain-containing protein [Anaerosporomusa subterranea]KYZ76605.1 hypothetical protein AXX12_09250 [Anaerosporomusa subterranea]
MDWQQILQDTWQTTLIFFALLLFTRILGKTQVGQLTFYEYVSGITIGSIAGNIVASEPDKFVSHFYDLVLFVALAYGIAHITLISRPMRKLIEGSPTLVIKDGRILRESMRAMRYDLDELNAQLRENGIVDLNEVHYAMIENNGTMTVVKKAAYQPVTRSDLAIMATEGIYPVELVMDGEIVEENLSEQHSREWLSQQLQAQGYADLTAVMYAVVDSKGNFFVCPKS